MNTKRLFVQVDYEPSAEEFDLLLAFVGGCAELVEQFDKANKERTPKAMADFSGTLNALLVVGSDLKKVSDRVKNDFIQATKNGVAQ